MQFDDLEPPYRTFLSDLLGRFGFDPTTFHLKIPERDEMFFRGVLPGYPGRPGAAFHRYFESALRTYDVYRQLAEFLGGFERLSRVLDFGSGHGRLTRSLVHRLAPHRIWACDIYPEAVAWQAETFGVNGLVSVADPVQLGLELEFDLVFAGSVFSHLPDALFNRWLSRLYRLVAPGGLIAFTVHDSGFAPSGQDIGPSGMGYAQTSESQTLDPATYGMSYVTEAYVARAIHEACGAERTAHFRRFPRAVYESQDLYVVSCADLTHLQVTATPIGGFKRSNEDGRIWTGWALDPGSGGGVTGAQLFIGEQPLGSTASLSDDPEVMRYFPGNPTMAKRWEFETRPLAENVMLRVELTSAEGAKAHCYAMSAAAEGGEFPRA